MAGAPNISPYMQQKMAENSRRYQAQQQQLIDMGAMRPARPGEKTLRGAADAYLLNLAAAGVLPHDLSGTFQCFAQVRGWSYQIGVTKRGEDGKPMLYGLAVPAAPAPVAEPEPIVKEPTIAEILAGNLSGSSSSSSSMMGQDLRVPLGTRREETDPRLRSVESEGEMYIVDRVRINMGYDPLVVYGTGVDREGFKAGAFLVYSGPTLDTGGLRNEQWREKFSAGSGGNSIQVLEASFSDNDWIESDIRSYVAEHVPSEARRVRRNINRAATLRVESGEFDSRALLDLIGNVPPA
ncbi:MAG: hypothetical protein QF632_02045 [Candidatus Woesearchaeota archaeon]|nr:hypothetical protein [Candidatus Woesearchaeota archaeon]MDP7323522.1 hypothetical protein [Candidatus Woesearchaeota archaeon]MDP7458577.1 hypothetical protein [Candidatus Woesearchaeota archaeon]